MTSENGDAEWKVLAKPLNIIKSVASQVPLASLAAEMLSQIEGHRTDQRILSIENEIERLHGMQKLEASQPPQQVSPKDWSHAAGDFLTRTVDICVVYDGKFEVVPSPGRELFKVVGHGCVVDHGKVLTCIEAIDIAEAVAERVHGKLVAALGMNWYDLSVQQRFDFCGLVSCTIGPRDEEKFQSISKKMREADLGEFKEPISRSRVQSSTMPWLGQEVGFLHDGEAVDVMSSFDWPDRQFESTQISHFRKLKPNSLKSFVTGVLPSRFLHAGIPVFSRDSTLLGIIGDAVNYESDAGRRAVVRSLLGHPDFTQKK